ncbi:MAG: glycosyltransferase, partial [Actinomycetia bacterium]|nr:glycosyltransferase [Actinomycetes bacterium]
LCHTLRGLYDTYPADFPILVDPATGIDDLMDRMGRVTSERAALPELFAIYDEAVARLGPDHPVFGHPGPFGRSLVHALDRVGMSPSAIKRHLAIAHTVAERDGYFPADATVGVIHPPTDLDTRPVDTPGDYFFTASRLDAPKRIDLIIEAFGQTDLDTRLLIAGSGPERDRLNELAAKDPRVELVGFVADDEMPALYAGAIAVPFIPDREDYGLIALEALASGTPVITCHDSGGPTELIQDGSTGRVVEADVAALANALTMMGNDTQEARRMGQAGRQSISHITWENLASKLVGPAAAAHLPTRITDLAPRTDRPLILVLNTFTAHNPKGGG